MLKTLKQFGILQKSDEEKEIEFAIQMKILESRRTDYSTESYDQAKSKVQIQEQQITAVEPLEQTLLKSARVQQTVQQAFIDLSRKVQTIQIQKQSKLFTEVKRFANNYFETNQGLEYLKYALEDQPIKKQKQKFLQQIEQFDNQPESIVPLEKPPWPQYNDNLTKVIIQPSAFTQAEIDEEIRLKKINDDSLKYRMAKRKDIDVYGKQRKDNKLVPYQKLIQNQNLIKNIYQLMLLLIIVLIMKQIGQIPQDQSEKSSYKLLRKSQANFLMSSKSYLNILFILFQQMEMFSNNQSMINLILNKLNLSNKPLLKKQVKDLQLQSKQSIKIKSKKTNHLMMKIDCNQSIYNNQLIIQNQFLYLQIISFYLFSFIH
ncbi:unnamed protein product [Paramecium sonneborni]|uniref:Uncharacterized protein n=1 Tax=Paramecium sonneborni TaxID=65129 RepID=A0A8S1R9Q6_9CILI|nr:unnamed protein product [Paramecium sonneborni]